jgi:hypothetical protein
MVFLSLARAWSKSPPTCRQKLPLQPDLTHILVELRKYRPSHAEGVERLLGELVEADLIRIVAASLVWRANRAGRQLAPAGSRQLPA